MSEEPAFPTSGDCYGSMGMTLRDFFAAAVMSGRAARDWMFVDDDTVKKAYRIADIMLKVREEEKE